MKFISDYGRNYQTVEEFAMRADLFKKKLQFFREHNANPENTHTVGIN